MRGMILAILAVWFLSGPAHCWAGRFAVSSPEEEARVVSEIRAAHFLTQATFGPTMEEIQTLGSEIRQKGYRKAAGDWIDRQFRLPASKQLPVFLEMLEFLYPGYRNENGQNVAGRLRSDAWWHNAITGEDQLRQRMAWALAQIFVVNDGNGFNNTTIERSDLPRAAGYSTFYDIFVDDAFGNYRSILGQVTAHPIMGHFLTHLNNRRAIPSRQLFPDENYAREVMQLFTIGLYKVKDLSGEYARDAEGNLIPTYDNEDTKTMARVFTGYTFNTGRNFPASPSMYTAPMRLHQNVHDRDEKILLDGTRLRANRDAQDDIDDALDMLFRQPETPPFVSKLLIQRFTHSNPTPQYVANVARWFHGGRRGQRGDLKAVIRAILLGSEASGLRIKRIRDAKFNVVAVEAQGRRNAQTSLREPVIRFAHFIRAFGGTSGATDNKFHLGDTRSFLNQSPFKSPSVFNFYSPDFQPPGPMQEAGLYGPEFQILTAVTVTEMFNKFRDSCRSERIDLGNLLQRRNFVRLDFDPVHAVARTDDRDAFVEALPNLLEYLDLLLCQGTMTEGFKQDMLRILRTEARSLRNSRFARQDMVETVIGLVLTSPDCAIVD